MITIEYCETEALFGSTARGDADSHSDVDYLIVDDNIARLSARKLALSNKGFSVSEYTWPRLVRLFKNKTLFSLHLKYESKIIYDQKSRFNQLINAPSPQSDYLPKYYESLWLFNILEKIPASQIGRAWALDHLAVAFRNSAILQFAIEGEYIFSFQKLLQKMHQKGQIGADDVFALRQLRRVKREYRLGIESTVGESYVTNAIAAANRAFRLQIEHREVTGVCLSNLAVKQESSTGAYCSLRAIEREMISIHCLSGKAAISARTELIRVVRNPHRYLWQAIHTPMQLNELLETVREGY